MASIRYDKIPLTLEFGANTEKIIAYDCSLSQAADLQPVRAIGFRGVSEQTPQGARTSSVSFSYTPVLTGTNIINEIASGLKNSRASQTSGVSIRFGGVSGEGLLSSYSLNLAPYSPAQCSVNFELFGSGQNIPVSGELKSQTVSRSSDVQALASNVGHSAFSSFMAGQSPATISSEDSTGILQSVDYSINFEYEPVYKLGQEFPSSFLYHAATEEARVTENVHETGISFTGKNENFQLKVKSLDNNSEMQINMERAVVDNSQISAGANGIAETSKTLRSFY
tara:strand:- start:443 stop:1288 length:846 start_codon:yes stop_codon:yes gene_type:complete